MKKLILLIAVFALALVACASGNVSANQNQSELSQNQQKWQDANIKHYRFNVFLSCFCAFNEDMPLIIEVKDGQVVSMEYASGKEIDAANREYFARFETLDRIFEQLQKDVGGEADEVVATYDATYGFPVDVKIDYIKEAVDDELYFTVSEFEPLQ
ncbi:MAG TPA: DUF6174 domain-containing protein [Anaerolineales bacterium]|nr:DUF6174 domain-containing protein [Anaerolineales bacterium]